MTVFDRRALPEVVVMTDDDRWQPTPSWLQRRRRPIWLMVRGRDDAAVLQQARLCRRWLPAGKGHRLSVARLPSVAAAVQAEGLHLSAAQMTQGRLNMRLIRRRYVISAACHHIADLRRALRRRVAVVLVSPVAPTMSTSARRVIPSLQQRLFCRQRRVPVYALGGITPGMAKTLRSKGYSGIAGVALARNL